ncbi:MAG: hypothetical protein KAS39_08970 [Actinomycetia bacterium]|nr:hypothetical protein [Actinomycetes bacterium]
MNKEKPTQKNQEINGLNFKYNNYYLWGFIIAVLIISSVVYYFFKPESMSATQILDKASLAMDNTVYYKAKVDIKVDEKRFKQIKEISGNNLHWKDEGTAQEQYYIDGTLFSLETGGIWKQEKVEWSRVWVDVNSLKKAKNLKLEGKEKIDGVWCYILKYNIEDLRATDYIKVADFLYLKAVTEAEDFIQTTSFYDYDKNIELKPPKSE